MSQAPDGEGSSAGSSGPAPGREAMNLVMVGHVDHGKSTLVGRLLHDSGAVSESRLEDIRAVCKRRGMPFEWAFLLDVLQAERDQGVTIDAAHVHYRGATRDYTIIDAPGHREFIRNMVTSAANVAAAVLVIDAAEGVCEQSRRHGYLLWLLDVRQVVVAITKMDLIDFDAARFEEIAGESRAYLATIGIEAASVVPVASRDGDNIARRSDRMAWYDGPTIAQAFDGFTARPPMVDQPLRLPIQDVYRFDERRIIAGRIETGQLRVGDEVLFSPSNKTAHVATIEGWDGEAGRTTPGEARAGQSIGLTLAEDIFVERGEVISHLADPPKESNVFRARMFWLGSSPLSVGQSFRIRLNTFEALVEVQDIERVIDTNDLAAHDSKPGHIDEVARDGIAEVVLRTREILALDEFTANPLTGRFVLVDGYDIAGGGIINMEGYPDQRDLDTVVGTNLTAVEHHISQDVRTARNNHRGGVLWFTGFSGSGKSTLALEVEQRLFRKGYQVYVLDGDNVRGGLNANLGFSPEDRAENIRRVGEVAALFADAGFIVISAFISPYLSGRERARAAAENYDPGGFHEIHIHADLEECERRDPKGLYKRARKGEIKEFTGISAPYEPPENPELVIDTGAESADICAQRIVDYIVWKFAHTGA
ncbi:MAG: adenylyl-sulfate kinase [Pseudomonadota bacterium]|nr:adenylyl-sulfate kinase [Pseudomonadota bacterium]